MNAPAQGGIPVPVVLMVEDDDALTYLPHHAMSRTFAGDSMAPWVIVDEEQARLAARDTGAGIDDAGPLDVFRDTGGPGPAVGGKIVKAHGGVMSMESTPGKGSLLVLSLPIRPRGAKSYPPSREGAA